MSRDVLTIARDPQILVGAGLFVIGALQYHLGTSGAGTASVPLQAPAPLQSPAPVSIGMTPAGPRKWIVDSSGKTKDSYHDLAEVLPKAGRNDTILLYPGVYAGNLTLEQDQRLTIRGEGGKEDEIVLTADAGTAIELRHSKLNLEGLTVLEPKSGSLLRMDDSTLDLNGVSITTRSEFSWRSSHSDITAKRLYVVGDGASFNLDLSDSEFNCSGCKFKDFGISSGISQAHRRDALAPLLLIDAMWEGGRGIRSDDAGGVKITRGSFTDFRLAVSCESDCQNEVVDSHFFSKTDDAILRVKRRAMLHVEDTQLDNLKGPAILAPAVTSLALTNVDTIEHQAPTVVFNSTSPSFSSPSVVAGPAPASVGIPISKPPVSRAGPGVGFIEFTRTHKGDTP